MADNKKMKKKKQIKKYCFKNSNTKISANSHVPYNCVVAQETNNKFSLTEKKSLPTVTMICKNEDQLISFDLKKGNNLRVENVYN